MKKISRKEFNSVEERLNFYDFDELSSRNQRQLVVKFKDEVSPVTYSDLQFDGNRAEYEEKEKSLKRFLKSLFITIGEPYCIIKKYNEKWVVNAEISPELATTLDKYSVSKKYNGAMAIEESSQLIELFIEAVLRYNSFVQFIFKEKEVVISPTDHMDIFIDSKEIDNLECEILGVIKECREDKLILLK